MAGTITLTTDGGTGTPLSLSIDAGALTLAGQDLTAQMGWATIPAQSLTVGVPFTLALADYAPADTGAYAVNPSGDSLPDWLTLDADTGVISGTPTTAQTKNVAFDATPSAEADWQSRISGPGVVWYHGFESDAEVDQFRWAGGYAGGNDPDALSDDAGYMTRGTTGGPPGTPGYLEILHPTGSNAPNVNWWRPFSALNSPGNGRATNDPAAGKTLRTWNPTDGSSTTNPWGLDFYGPTTYQQTFYLQIRFMSDPRRYTSNPEPVGKKLFITTTTNTLTAQELVTYAGTLYHRMYFGGSPPLESADTLGRDGQQVGGELSTYPSDYCDIGTNPSKCWSFGTNQWDTVLYAITPGTSTSAPRSTVVVYAANAGQTSYTKIWDMQFDHEWNQAGQYGWNAICLNDYMNGANFTQPFWQRYGQIIFSTEMIPCPQA